MAYLSITDYMRITQCAYRCIKKDQRNNHQTLFFLLTSCTFEVLTKLQITQQSALAGNPCDVKAFTRLLYSYHGEAKSTTGLLIFPAPFSLAIRSPGSRAAIESIANGRYHYINIFLTF